MKIIKFLSLHFWHIVISLLVLGAIATIYLYTYPARPAVFNKVEVLNEVKAGGEITYQLDFCRYVQKGTEIHPRRFLVPKDKPISNSIELSSNPSLETEGKPGCYPNSPPITIPVDSGASPGTYRLYLQVRYCILVGRCIPVEIYSDYFELTELSVPDQLSVINKQLEAIQKILPGQEVGTANVVQPATTQSVTTPQTQGSIAPVVDEPATPERPVTQPQQGLIQSTLNTTRSTLDNLTKMIGL